MTKMIASAACVALKEALSAMYWYKSDLRSFLSTTISNPSLLAPLNWEDYKRNIVMQLVDYMAKRQDKYQGELLRLMSEVSCVDDFSHLERLDGGKEKAQVARKAVSALRKHMAGHELLAEEQRKIEERRRKAHEALLRTTAVREGLEKLNRDFLSLLSESNAQQRVRLAKIPAGIELVEPDLARGGALLKEQHHGFHARAQEGAAGAVKDGVQIAAFQEQFT